MSLFPRTPGADDRDLTAAIALVDGLRQALPRDDRVETVAAVRGLIELRAPMGEQWQQLARIAADNGELTLSHAAIDLYVEHYGGGPAARYQKAGLLAYLGAWGEAHTLMKALPPGVPDRASYAHSRGTAALHLGDAEEARGWLELAVTLGPQAGVLWQSLATLVDFADEPHLADRIVAAEPAMAGGHALHAGPFYYALGKAHADRGEHARAFAGFARGARAMTSLFSYDREADRKSAAEAVEGYDAARLAAIARRQSEPTGRTIFVTGLPRSGTTLVEQILTSHSAVDDGSEINRLSLFAKDMGGLSHAALDRYLARTGPAAAARLWRHWIGERFPGTGRVVDKTTNSTRVLGVAAALLPEAPLIWLRRDPLDCAWSCFRTFFRDNLAWSQDLADMAFHFRLEDALLARWQDILGDRLLVVSYERLVTEPQPEIRRILAHCGLAEEPQVFAPHENRRTVTSSSVMQVRRPINRAGIGVAQPYREFLAPFIEAYRS